MVVRNGVDRNKSKELGTQFARQVKYVSLDDNPDEKSLGKGLYSYEIKVQRANTDIMADGFKKADQETIEWAIEDEDVTPADDARE